MVKKIISYILIFAIVFSFAIVPSFASSSGSVLVDSASEHAWSVYFDNNYILGSYEGLGLNAKSFYWKKFDAAFASLGLGQISSYDALIQIASRFKSTMSRSDGSFTAFDFNVSLGRPVPTATVAYDSSLGVYRLRDDYSGLWLVNSAGHFPYYKEVTNEEDDGSSPTLTYSWWNRVDTTGISIEVLPQDDLKTIAKRYSGYVRQVGEYYMIVDVTGSKYLCSAGGHRLAAIVDLDQTAVDQTNNYYTEEGDTVYNEYQGGDTIINEGDTFVYEGDTITNNSTTVYEGDETTYNQFIDITDNSVNIDGNQYVIDNLYWDESTQSYYVDSHDQYVYNSETNEYTSNNYTFKITYDIHYTSVTYIGQTEEFEADTYVYYYQLPDGRSSADLTAEDLEQLSLAFDDVVNYARSTDAADMRCLYHFDGNVEDSSYWSYCTVFDWASGASLTYLDEGTFNGSLYLDETEHEFSIQLPNESDASYDFTLQFRYYQSATAAPVKDSYIRFGQYTFLQFDGSHYYTGTGVDLGATSVGTWNEICMMRSGSTVYYYINGVCVDSVVSAATFPSELIFHFGSKQQTYKKLDELRYTRSAVYAPGADYTPSAVPFDTNLTLILPDGERPLADEIAVVVPSENNLLVDAGLSDWSTDDVLDQVQTTVTHQNNYLYDLSGGFTLYSYAAGLTHSGSSVNFTASGSAGVPDESNNSSVGYLFYYPENCLFIPVSHGYKSSNSYVDSLLTSNANYVLSVVYSDGTYDSFTFSQTALRTSVNSSSGVGRLKCSVDQAARYNTLSDLYYYTNGLVLAPVISGDTVEIVHMEIVQGSSPEYTVTWETAMYSSGELEDSPVLAVRSNTPISSYVFGGVRPSYPERGQVWAMIEGHRIVSLQQYTGSAWVEVDGRVWTGKRWIPYGSFDVFTLQDCWDIVDSGEDDDFEYIYTESGFWNWLQKAWIKMLQKLDAIILALGGDPDALPGDNPDSDLDLTFWQRVKKIFEDSLAKIIESLLDLITKILDVVLKLVYDLLEFFFSLLSDLVVNGIGNFFDALTDEALLQFFHREEPVLDENGNPVLDENGDPVTVKVVDLPAGVSGVFAFISAAITVLPGELRSVLFFGIGALFLLAVLKLMKS